jgi:hypothetical protein
MWNKPWGLITNLTINLDSLPSTPKIISRIQIGFPDY